MSKWSDYKRRVRKANISPRNSGLVFFRNNPDIHEVCQNILKNYGEVFKSCGEVLKSLFMGKKIRRCKICGKRLNYKRSNDVFPDGRMAKTCSMECRIKNSEESYSLRKQNTLEKYGVENISQLQSIKDKKK